MKKPRVGVIMGGTSGEREVSLRSGAAVADALARARTRRRAHRALAKAATRASPSVRSGIDVAFLALHGRLARTAACRASRARGIPYTGSSVLASALAMDKLKSKELFRLHNVPTPPYYTVRASDDLADLEEIHGSFGFPVIVKPRGEGLVARRDQGELARRARARARRGARSSTTSRSSSASSPARKCNVGILNGRVLGAIEVAPKNGIYDYEAKYTPGHDRVLHARAPPADALRAASCNLAERAAARLGCTGGVRVDLLVTEGRERIRARGQHAARA